MSAIGTTEHYTESLKETTKEYGKMVVAGAVVGSIKGIMDMVSVGAISATIAVIRVANVMEAFDKVMDDDSIPWTIDRRK